MTLLSMSGVAFADDIFTPLPKSRVASNSISNSLVARSSGPTLALAAADIVSGSIVIRRAGTNFIAVCWTYTEEGAKKALAFWESHPSPNVCRSEEWKTGWLKSRTDKCVFDNEEAAQAFMAKLKNK